MTQPLRRRTSAEQLAHFGVPLPADAQRWHQRLLELQKSRPEAPPHGHVAELIAGGADQAAIDKLVAQQVGQSFRQQEHAEAIRLCGRRVLASVREHRDHLHAQLADIANDIITQLHNAAALDADITQLAREKRVDDAALLASAPSHAATLQDLYKVRDWYLGAAGRGLVYGHLVLPNLVQPMGCAAARPRRSRRGNGHLGRTT